MDALPVIVLSTLVLGAGVACVLFSAARMLSARDASEVDKVSLAWGAAIVLEMAALWRLVVLAHGPWPLSSLAVLAGAAVALLVAAFLILPVRALAPEQTARMYFDARGRWGVLGLAAFNAIVIAANREVWYEGLLSDAARVNLVLGVIAVAGFLAKGRARVATVAGYLAIFLWNWAGLPTFG